MEGLRGKERRLIDCSSVEDIDLGDVGGIPAGPQGPRAEPALLVQETATFNHSWQFAIMHDVEQCVGLIAPLRKVI